MSNDAGWFCTGCPTVVMNIGRVDEMLANHKPGWDVGVEFAVVGIVDLLAVPDRKRHVNLGTDAHPWPVVPFTRVYPGPGIVPVELPSAGQHPAGTGRRRSKKRR